MIKFGRMRIENFKSFLEPIEFNFTNKDLVLFDGPNGFGKTTIYDAIELCFTNKVTRINATDSKVKADHILKGENSQPTYIYLELLHGDETLMVICVHIPENIAGQQGKVSKYSNVISRFTFDAWKDTFSLDDSDIAPIDQNNLKKILESVRLESTYTLFNYIQQEETCHYLKINEKERHQQINYLFGTQRETNDQKKLELVSSKLKDYIVSINTEIDRKQSELKDLSKPIGQGNERDEVTGSGKISLFTDLTSATLEQLESYYENLFGAEWILKESEEFKKLRFNHVINRLVSERKAVLEDLVKVGVTKKYSEIEKLYKHQASLNSLQKKVNDYKDAIALYSSSPNRFDEKLFSLIECYFPNILKRHMADISEYRRLVTSCDSLNTLLTKIQESRKRLLDHYEQHNKLEELIPCPLCGDIKPDWKSLLAEYEQQSDSFSVLLGDSGKKLVIVTSSLSDTLIKPIVKLMESLVSKYVKYLTPASKRFFDEKLVLKQDYESMDKVRTWLQTDVPEYREYIDQSLFTLKESYQEAVNLLIVAIQKHLEVVSVDVPKSYIEFIKDLKSLDLAFDQNKNLPVSLPDIEVDQEYLSKLITQKKSGRYIAKEKEIERLTRVANKLEAKKVEVSTIIRTYKSQIKAYEKSVAKHIAIPLYVYSSKILQARPEGNGIFLLTPDDGVENGYIRFSATAKDSHDAWNTMSSGQLAGVVISFMLAMNKVYPTKLATLMIDDPVQTMDEVNMASFVQMLRYEFPDKQILLSTHESKVANYFNYKYSRAGLSTLPINMKSKRLELAS